LRVFAATFRHERQMLLFLSRYFHCWLSPAADAAIFR
jgi:hypothetical protein